ncbi:hypothetical protein M0G43_05910 [Subsaxibacter sp. CAU 1640]|uniref:hypothetical protein n=1 Tax=Subsaxibacter sp. CAU 1640 TaxID=2933271 RepID=UPI002002E15E|nr:hypothetical protein [Subsaxibacter sp. CAU 1640]MCK7590099.1 hypothetical protein [Subsaxibacter sp. CAU 1640]
MSKFSKYFFAIFTLALLISISSCRKEEMEFQQEQPDDTLSPNSEVADLMQRTAMNDGSVDNILFNANCFTIQLPVDVVANGVSVSVNSISDLNMVESIFDNDDDDTDTLEIQFPISIVLNDFSVVNITSLSELYSYANNCNGENEWDDDIECLDFQYPISASIYNIDNEIISTITVNSDEQMYNFIDDIDESDIITIDFPISITISTGESLTINSLSELQNTIQTYADDCDEDDDYDYNDDDCNNCTPLQLVDILTNCPDWMVDKLERNDNDYDDIYDGYRFNFFTDGSVSVSWNATTVYGTWSANGTGNNITVDINIPSLPYCNLDWNLHEIEQNSGETKVDLRQGDDDRMRYESNCN